MMNSNEQIIQSRKKLVESLCEIYQSYTIQNIEDDALHTFLKDFHTQILSLNNCATGLNGIKEFLSTAKQNATLNQGILASVDKALLRINSEVLNHLVNMKEQTTKIKNYSLYGTILPSIPSVIGLILYFTTPLGIATLIAAGGAVGVLILGQAIYWACMASCYVDLTKKIADPHFQPTLGEGKALSEDALPKAPVKYVTPRVSLQNENSSITAEPMSIASAISTIQQTQQYQALIAKVEEQLPGAVDVITEVSQNTAQLLKDGWDSGFNLFNQTKQYVTEQVEASRSNKSSALYQRLLG